MSPIVGPARDVTQMVLTKYNARFPTALYQDIGRNNPNQPPGLDPTWLELRLRLFAEWPLPSLRRQTEHRFNWLLFVDAETPTPYVRRLQRLCGETAQIVLVDGPLTDTTLQAHVNEIAPVTPHVLVTTRLDSDDAMAPTLLERVRQEASTVRGFINPRHGFQVTESGAVYRRWDRSSPFLSFVEERDPAVRPTTVFSIDHWRAAEAAPVRQLGGAPGWVQVVHGRNIANDVEGLRWRRDRAEAALGFRLSISPVSTAEGMAWFRPLRSQLRSEVSALARRFRV